MQPMAGRLYRRLLMRATEEDAFSEASLEEQVSMAAAASAVGNSGTDDAERSVRPAGGALHRGSGK